MIPAGRCGVDAVAARCSGMISPHEQLAIFVFALTAGVVLVLAQQWWFDRQRGGA